MEICFHIGRQSAVTKAEISDDFGEKVTRQYRFSRSILLICVAGQISSMQSSTRGKGSRTVNSPLRSQCRILGSHLTLSRTQGELQGLELGTASPLDSQLLFP